MKLYRINEYVEDERLYSTGDDELDELLERAFSEGYEYALEEQREYGFREYRKATAEAKRRLASFKKAVRRKLEREAGVERGRLPVDLSSEANINAINHSKENLHLAEKKALGLLEG